MAQKSPAISFSEVLRIQKKRKTKFISFSVFRDKRKTYYEINESTERGNAWIYVGKSSSKQFKLFGMLCANCFKYEYKTFWKIIHLISTFNPFLSWSNTRKSDERNQIVCN